MQGLGGGQRGMVQAQFRLTENPILILTDDPAQRVDVLAVYNDLFDDLAQELLRNKAASRIVPRQTIEFLRQSAADFHRRGAREIGEMAKAEQVIWIEIEDFLADEQFEDHAAAAYFSATVKVLNVLETEHRARVRLWPESPAGYRVGVALTAREAAKEQIKSGIARELSRRLAVEIGRLFYDHRPES